MGNTAYENPRSVASIKFLDAVGLMHVGQLLFPVAQVVKNLPAMKGLIPGSGRSSGEGNGNPLQ